MAIGSLPAADVVEVAPLTGSVDRNADEPRDVVATAVVSLPSRGAWIEMTLPSPPSAPSAGVAPLTGSVDRNAQRYTASIRRQHGRSPHGERG